MSGFPIQRMRRMRATPAIRALRRETRLSTEDFILPLFVVEDASAAGPVASMPGVERFTVTGIDREIQAAVSLGIRGVLVFGVPAQKDASASAAAGEESAVASAVRRIKSLTDRLAVITDVCLCSYTDHGHCGVIRPGAGAGAPSMTAGSNTAGPAGSRHAAQIGCEKGFTHQRKDSGCEKGFSHQRNTIDNDATLEILSAVAVAHARAGADVVAPSGMMDGAIAAIRSGLDAAGLMETAILAYAVKYASSFYGPFRDAADSAPAFGDRRSYQMDPANAREALAEAELDLGEGADAIMVKPAMPYLDVIRRVRDAHPSAPLAAYQVSGEYSMIAAAAANGWLDRRAVALESLTAIKRAGADMIITYFAKDAAGWLHEAG